MSIHEPLNNEKYLTVTTREIKDAFKINKKPLLKLYFEGNNDIEEKYKAMFIQK